MDYARLRFVVHIPTTHFHRKVSLRYLRNRLNFFHPKRFSNCTHTYTKTYFAKSSSRIVYDTWHSGPQIANRVFKRYVFSSLQERRNRCAINKPPSHQCLSKRSSASTLQDEPVIENIHNNLHNKENQTLALSCS